MRPGSISHWAASLVLAGILSAPLPTASASLGGAPAISGGPSPVADSAVGNYSAALQRLVDLVAVGAGAFLALVWARVAFSWFSNDITKKVQAKDRARDALVGTLILGAALTGLVWGLARWVLTGH